MDNSRVLEPLLCCKERKREKAARKGHLGLNIELRVERPLPPG